MPEAVLDPEYAGVEESQERPAAEEPGYQLGAMTLAAAPPAPTAQKPPPPPPPSGMELPPWDEIKQSDTYKQASDAQRTNYLKEYTRQAGQILGTKTAGNPEATQAAKNELEDFYNREQVAVGERYWAPVNAVRAFTHGAVSATARLPRETAEAIQAARESVPVESGVNKTPADIRGLSVDQAKDQLVQQQDKLKEVEDKIPAAQKIRTAAQGIAPDQWDQQIVPMPEAKMFQGSGAEIVDQARKVEPSAGFLRERIGYLQNYIKSRGDPNAVPDYTKPLRKFEKWGEGFMAPDVAFATEHPLASAAFENLGNVVPYIAGRVGIGVATGGLGVPAEIGGIAANVADASAQLVDMYSQTYKNARANLESQRKEGRVLSDAQIEQMARDDASKQLFNIPFMTFSHGLMTRAVESGLSRIGAEQITNQFINRVMVPGLKEGVTQAGVGAGMSAIQQMSDQMSGVSTKPFSVTEMGQQALAMGLGMGGAGAAFRAGGFALQRHMADRAAVDQTVERVRALGQAWLQVNPDQNIDDIHENLIKQVPARWQDSVRAKLNLQKASTIQKEVSADLKKTGSPETAAEIDKDIVETDQQDTTPPRPAALTPEQRAEMGEGVIHQALANGHISDEQHANLIATFEKDPTQAMQDLGKTLGLSEAGSTLENIQAKTKVETPAAKKEVTPPAPTVEKKEEVPPAKEERVTPAIVGELGKGISESMRDMLWDKFQKGDTTEAGMPSNVLQLAAREKAAGRITTREEFNNFVSEYGSAPEEVKKRVLAAVPAPPAEKVIPPELIAGLNADQTGAVTELVRTHDMEPAEATALIKKFGPIGNQAELVSMARRLQRMPKKEAPAAAAVAAAEKPPAPTPPVAGEPAPETSQTALLGKVADYLGPAAMGDKTQRLEFGRDFLAGVPQQDRPAAAQLLHRLRLEELPEGEHENWARIPAEQQGHMMALMSRFIDNRIATQGRQAAKPVFARTMKISELSDIFKRNAPEELQSHLLAGRVLTVNRNDLRPGGPLELWLDNNKFHVSASADGKELTIGPSGQVKSFYEQLKERSQQIRKAQKRRPGRPTRQVYIISENSPEYKAATEALPAHPAEEEEIEKVTPTIIGRLPSDETGELVSGVTNKYRRQLRIWAQRMVNAGRNDDMRLLGQKTALEVQLTKLNPDTAAYEATEEALKLGNNRIKETKADRPVLDPTDKEEHKHPDVSPIISSMDRDYRDWKESFKNTYGETVSLQRPLEEGEEASLEDVIRERPVTPEDENRQRNFLDTDHETEVAEFVKQLRTKEEKAYAYHIANELNFIYERPEIKPPEELPKPTLRSKQLLNRITDEYIRFVESRQPRPAGEGREERGETTAAAAGRGALPPTIDEEIARRAGPGIAPGGAEADSALARESSALTARDQGVVAERELTPGGNRQYIAGDPGRTSEDQARATGPAAELLGGATATVTGRTAEEQAGRAGAAGTVARDPVTGQRIAVTPGGAERSRAPGPRLTPEGQIEFERSIDSDLNATANRIWHDWKMGEEWGTGYGKLFGLNQKNYDNPAQLKTELKRMINGMVRQEPTVAGRTNLARDILLGLPQFYEESMSASQLRRQRLFDRQTTPVTTKEQLHKIVLQSYDRYRPAFNALGVPIREMPITSLAWIRSHADGRIEFQHNLSEYDKLSAQNLTEGRLRAFAEAAAQEELIHAAQFGWYREQWRTAPGKTYDRELGLIRDRNFNEYRQAKGQELMDSFGAAYESARQNNNYKLMNDLDRAIGASIYHYFSGTPGAEKVVSWNSYNKWLGTLDPEKASDIRMLAPFELARQLTQLRISGQLTELPVQRLLHHVYNAFMDALRYLRRMALRVTEGDMGQAWKDTITTLENRVRILQEKINVAKPPETPQKELFESSQALAQKLGAFFHDNILPAQKYGLNLDARNAVDYANKIMARHKTAFGDNLQLIHDSLYQTAVREGLIAPTEFTTPVRDPGKTMYVGRVDSLAPGMEAHALDEGKPHELARFLRHSTDPEMREFAKSLTSHREKLMPVPIRQLNNNVPAAFYHNGELFVTRATLDHPDGQKAMAHELQHAIAQEILAKPNVPHEHEAAAHALALVDEFRSKLPADIRDAADHKMPELFDHMDASGTLNLDHVTDQEKAWMPLIEAARNPSEFVKKAFSSANFRDFLRNTKADRGGSLWDKTHDWGRTLFGDQAFKYAPEVSEITYNRPGAVMRSDPRERGISDPISPEKAELIQYGQGIANHLAEEIEKLDPKNQERINSFTDPLKAWQEGQLNWLSPKLVNLLQRQREVALKIRQWKDEPSEPSRRDIMRKYGFDQGAEHVMGKIAELSDNPSYTQLAKALQKSLAGSPRIRVVADAGAGGAYIFTGDKIRLSEAHIKGENLHRDLLHETVHALVSGKISAYLTGRMDLLTPEEKTAIGELEKLRQLATEWGINHEEVHPDFAKILDTGGYEARQNLYTALGRREKYIRDFYGLIDLNEFASEALTNPKFQKFLNRIPHKEEGRKLNTLWQKFIDWTKRMLGIKPGDTALNAVLENVAKISEGQRLVQSDFNIDGVTGAPTVRLAAARMELDFLKKKAAAEGYADPRDVPKDTWENWSNDYRQETMFTGQFAQKIWDGIIDSPKRDSMITPSKELAQKTSPEDIVDHVARVTGTSHLDSEGLRRAIDRAHQDGALRDDQYLGTQDFLNGLDRHTMRYLNPLGDKDDPNSPERVLRRWGKAFLSAGWLPKELHDMQLKHIEYAANELGHKARAWVRDFNTILKRGYGDIKDPRFVPARTMDLFNDVLKGKYKSMPQGMPIEMWNHLKAGRKMIDDLSEQLLANGIAAPESDLEMRIKKGMGKYVSASYQIISDPRFRVDENIKKRYWGAAIAPMKAHWIDVQAHEAASQAARVYRPGTSAYEEARVRRYWSTRNKLEDSVTNAAVEQHMQDLLLHYAQTAEAMNQPGRTFGPAFMLNDKIVTDLTKLPPEFKRLMGEERDVRTNLVNTLFRQNRYLHTIQLAKEMWEAGKGTWFANASDPSRGLTHQIAPEVTFQRVQGKTPEEQVRKHAIFGNLAGKWTTKEIHDFINGYDKLIRQDPGMFMKMLNSLESSARYLTTILSVHRGVGNLFAAPFSMIQNGMLPLDAASGRATMSYLQHMFGGTNEERNRRIERAMQCGVLDKNIDQATLNDIMRVGSKYTEYGRGPLDFLEAVSESALKHPLWSRIQLLARDAREQALKFHTAGNDIAKMAQWEVKQRFLRDVDNEDLRMRKARYDDLIRNNVDPKDAFDAVGPMTPKTDQEIEEEAGRIVRDTNVSYSLASPALRRARAQPVIGTFLTYWNEMARAYLNQLNYARKYLLSKNRVEQIEGMRRAGGLAVGGGIAFALGMASRAMFGVTDRKDRNIRALLPPWEQNDIRLYLGPERNGKLTYVNLNYIMPQGDLARGLMALFTPNPHGGFGNITDAIGEIFHPTYNIGLMPGAIADSLRNQTEYGTQVYNPEDDLLPKAGAITQHILGRWWGGTLGRAAQQLPNLGKVTPGGNVYDPFILATKEFLGQDIHQVSIPDRFRSTLFSSKDDIKNAQRIFTSPIQRTNNQMTDGQIAQTYLHMERVRKIVFDQLHEKVEAALDSGMSLREVKSALKERGYSGKLTHDLLAGRYYSYRPGKGILQNARTQGNIVPRSLFSSSAKDYDEE